MARRARKAKTTEEMVEQEKARMAAHGVVLSDEQAVQAVTTGKVEVDPNPSIAISEEEAQAHADSLAEDKPEPEVEAQGTEEGDPEEGGDQEDQKPVTTVVADKYKTAYIANAKEKGIAGKAAKRSNWDWLAEQLAKACLVEKEKISIERFIEVLDLNGVNHSKWTNRNRGWEGRFRMTGRVVLQKKVADANCLYLPGNVEVVPPPEFVARFKTKN